jgi:hypothetical protein
MPSKAVRKLIDEFKESDKTELSLLDLSIQNIQEVPDIRNNKNVYFDNLKLIFNSLKK